MNPQQALAKHPARIPVSTATTDESRLTGRVVETPMLTAVQREQMFRLMTAHYDGMLREQFDRDLAEKQWVIVVERPRDGEILGFSTQCLLRVPGYGPHVRALFSGDTIVHRDYWGRNPLNQLWGRFALSLAEQLPQVALYWFLISKGYKTYRMLPVFFHEFYPRYDAATPGHLADMLAAVARSKFGSAYDASCGVVRSKADGCRLRAGVADMTPQRLKDPHLAFFQHSNPQHAQGDELCCLAPLARDNFTAAAHRVMSAADDTGPHDA